LRDSRRIDTSAPVAVVIISQLLRG